MAGDRQGVRLEELVDPDSPITYGVVQPGPTDPEGVQFVRGGDVVDGRILEEQLRTISKEVSEQYSRTLLRGGELLVSLVGNPGAVALVPHSLAGANIARQVGLVRLRREVDPRFVMYYLGSREGKAALGAQTMGSVQQVINLRDLRNVQIPLPGEREQRAIVAVLGGLDDKIELNRRTNQTLEAMARALFKSWFVDFDPVRAKSEGRAPAGMDPDTAALFPYRIIGDMPEGWQRRAFGDVCTKVATGPFGSSIKAENFVPAGVPVIRGQNLSDGFRDDDFVYLREEKADELQNANVGPGDIVFTHRGTLGQVGLIHEKPKYERYVVSQSQMYARVRRDALSRLVAYYHFRAGAGMAELMGFTATTGVPAIAQPTTSLKRIGIVVPPLPVSEAFDRIVGPLIEKATATMRECETLAALRDALLPKLLSGELRVREAEGIVDRAV